MSQENKELYFMRMEFKYNSEIMSFEMKAVPSGPSGCFIREMIILLSAWDKEEAGASEDPLA